MCIQAKVIELVNGNAWSIAAAFLSIIFFPLTETELFYFEYLKVCLPLSKQQLASERQKILRLCSFEFTFSLIMEIQYIVGIVITPQDAT